MRLEATIPDSRAQAALQLASELGLSRSQFMDEALGLFVKIVIEARKGRRVVSMDRDSTESCELTSPTLAMLELANSEPIRLSETAFAKLQETIANPPPPSLQLRELARRHSKQEP